MVFTNDASYRLSVIAENIKELRQSERAYRDAIAVREQELRKLEHERDKYLNQLRAAEKRRLELEYEERCLTKQVKRIKPKEAPVQEVHEDTKILIAIKQMSQEDLLKAISSVGGLRAY